MQLFIENTFFPSGVEKLYQYYSTDTFMKMVEKKQLWLTDISKMNDSAEEKWAERLIDDVYQSDPKNNIYPQEFFEGVNKTLREGLRKFISCFSEDADVLSQWRAYADDGKGFSVGFAVNKLGVTPEIPEFVHPSDKAKIFLLKVLYNQTKQKDFISKCIARVAESPGETPYEGDHVLPKLAIALKNPAFAEEKEWRLVFQLNVYGIDLYLKKDAVSKCFFRPTLKGLSPYFVHDFNKTALVEVKLGPKNGATEQDVEWFMKKHGFCNVTISKSLATYQ